MGEERNKVVPFERPAAYWVSRARKCRGRTRLSDAAPLLRQAYRQSGSDDVALELAAAYCAMECYSAARRVLTEVLSRSPNCAEAYYVLGVTALAQQDERLAEDALATSLTVGGDSSFADDAQDMLNNYPWHDEHVWPRGSRGETLYFQALDALAAGDADGAVCNLQKALKRSPAPRSAALLGELCLKSGKYNQACALLLYAARMDGSNIPCALLLCQTLCEMAQMEAAKLLLKSLSGNCVTHAQLALFAQVCCRAGCAELAVKRLEEALKAAPQSNDLLLILAAVRRATGDMEGARRLLHTILSRDAEDADAAAALKLIKARPIPFERARGEDILQNLCARKPISGDAALRRLVHGMTISLDGALSYQAVKKLVSHAWEHMNETQKKRCDTSRLNLWPRAFYRYLLETAGEKSPPPALYEGHKYERQVRRMARFIKNNEAWSEIK